MDRKQFKIVGLGEILWGVLPTGKQIGGAPANFAFIATQLGDCGTVASRVGNDADGAEILNRLQALKVETKRIQIDETRSTGIVKVDLQNGQPHYSIVENVAWDSLELTDDWRSVAAECDAVCFGSLAQRNPVSQKTICNFLALTKPAALRIFDCNLRQNYFSKEILTTSLQLANAAKLNHEELPVIAEVLQIGGEDEIVRAKNLREKFDLQIVCITRGANGSLILNEKEMSQHAGVKTAVKNTIGAGDAFTATITHGLLRGWSLEKINTEANRIGAFVASQTGAMPALSI